MTGSSPIPDAGAGYAGDVSPTQAYELLAEDDAVLVDVRTQPEWHFVGLPDLAPLDKLVIGVPWQQYPDGSLNHDFVDQLAGAGVPENATVLFICRSGARSRSAAIAATTAGYTTAYNVADGFEGPVDQHGHRTSRGWKAAGLPWRQS